MCYLISEIEFITGIRHGVFIHWLAEDDKKIYDWNYEATKMAIAKEARTASEAAEEALWKAMHDGAENEAGMTADELQCVESQDAECDSTNRDFKE